MGSSASKASRAAGGAATRKYPSRLSQIPSQASNVRAPPPAREGSAGPTVRPQAQASSTRDEAINLDATDPAFAQSLRSLGPVQPNPQLSPSSAFASPNPAHPSQAPQPHFPDPAQLQSNPALTLLRRREELAAEAEEEFQRRGKSGEGRRFLDAVTIGRILRLRDQGRGEAEIEREMGLSKGVVAKLGERGLVEGA
ncbi:hypothetical protein EV356DRAFT_508085 [Viridothelium virens]|uniref:Helix-turn-helix domain-containing protein n=1 Tax=Viridothelium virens TaxID=1048519 RepID=A0A6A6GYB1_VIRVR|nr:hypothetical protein EV356DRAFT_508085 [Viridothelium virens]